MYETANNYLPRPKTQVNPNVKGGSIKIDPRAPNKRLDAIKRYDKMLKEIRDMTIQEMMVQLCLGHIIDPKL